MQHVFAGVCANATLDLDRMSTDTKRSVWKDKGLVRPQKWPSESIPWHWSDVLPMDVWDSVMTMLRVASVVDLSAGPTCLRSCLKSGTSYFGICHNDAFCAWLQAVADKESLKQLG